MFENQTDDNGFTLIELLVVIAIIAVLTATILPSLAESRRSARRARLQAEMRSFTSEAVLFAIENGNYGSGGILVLESTNGNVTTQNLTSAGDLCGSAMAETIMLNILDVLPSTNSPSSSTTCISNTHEYLIYHIRTEVLFEGPGGATVGTVYTCIDSTGHIGEQAAFPLVNDARCG